MDVAFDDPNLVADAGLVPVLALAERVGLPDLVDDLVSIMEARNSAEANPGAKVMSPPRSAAPIPRFTDLYDSRQLNPVVIFQPMDATEIERRRQRNRIHVELLMPSDQLRTRVDAAVAAGGRMLEEERSPDRCRLADPEGNEVVLRAAPSPGALDRR